MTVEPRKVEPVTGRAAGILSAGGTAGRTARPMGVGRAVRRREEDEFSEKVRELIKMLPGLLAYHTHDSRRSEAGFPDWVITGRGGILYRELKTATGKVTPAQSRWLSLLREGGGDASVWRPADLDNGRIWRELRAVWKTP